jgi:hypothetical protein
MEARWPRTLPLAVSASSSFVRSRREVFVKPPESASGIGILARLSGARPYHCLHFHHCPHRVNPTA